MKHVKGVSDADDERNMLARVAANYEHVLVPATAGDVVFFGGHVLHMSKANLTTDRFRRAFVGHYCNARSFTQWGADAPRDDVHASHVIDPLTKMSNGSHILARGDTHLPFARPRFGTPSAATLAPDARRGNYERVARIITSANDGLLGCATPEDMNRR